MRFRAILICTLLSCTVATAQSTEPASSPGGAQSSTSPPSATSGQNAAISAPSQAGDSTQLIIIKFRKPDYPIEAANEQIQGRVVIHLLINESGDVESAEAVSGNAMLSDAAIRAMKTWKFKPYLKDGRPVKVSTKMPYDFAFQDRVKDVPAVPAVSDMTSKPSSDGSNGANLPRSVSISEGVSQGLLLHKVIPVYPRSAKAAHVQGTVVLQALIGKDGLIENLHRLSGPPELVDAAIGAVSQWRYRPYILKGEPVEVQTTINVNFSLSP